MAFISSGYNPAKPMEDRITDIGPRHFEEFYPPVIKKNKGQWDYHEIVKPGVLKHVALSGDVVYTVRVGGARLMVRSGPARWMVKKPCSAETVSCRVRRSSFLA